MSADSTPTAPALATDQAAVDAFLAAQAPSWLSTASHDRLVQLSAGLNAHRALQAQVEQRLARIQPAERFCEGLLRQALATQAIAVSEPGQLLFVSGLGALQTVALTASLAAGGTAASGFFKRSAFVDQFAAGGAGGRPPVLVARRPGGVAHYRSGRCRGTRRRSARRGRDVVAGA